jgi:hypothetical protein
MDAGIKFLLVIPDARSAIRNRLKSLTRTHEVFCLSFRTPRSGDPESVWIATGLEPIPGSVCDGAAVGPGMTRFWGD